MSRSKKAPIYKDSANKSIKRQASRAVRNLPLESTPKSGKGYRKNFNSWNISDWSFRTKDKKATRK